MKIITIEEFIVHARNWVGMQMKEPSVYKGGMYVKFLLNLLVVYRWQLFNELGSEEVIRLEEIVIKKWVERNEKALSK